MRTEQLLLISCVYFKLVQVKCDMVKVFIVECKVSVKLKISLNFGYMFTWIFFYVLTWTHSWNLFKHFRYTIYTWFVQKVSGSTTVHEVGKAYGVLTLIVFNTVPFRSYTLRLTVLPLLETFCELLFRDLRRISFDVLRCLKSVSFQNFLKPWE